MSNDKIREEFEAWAATKGMAMHLARAESGLYVSRVTQNYMDCWMDSQVKKADELEALREFKRHMVEMREADGFESWAEVLVTVDQLKAEVEALRRSLLEASEEVATWGAYASEYFQEKHDLAGCVARLHDAAMSKESGHD